MLATTSSRELSEWMAFSRLEPLGEARADLRIADLMELTFNLQRGKQKERTWRDFFRTFEEKEPESPKSMLDTWRGITARFRAKEKKE